MKDPVHPGEILRADVLDELGLSVVDAAARLGVSRVTLSRVLHGHARVSPNLAVRLEQVGVGTARGWLALQTAHDLHVERAGGLPDVQPLNTAPAEAPIDRGRPIQVSARLPRLRLEDALATVELPLHLNWSDRGRTFDLRDRRQRARLYEIVLREGGPADVRAYIDGALLVDLWDELVLPAAVRTAWQAAVESEPG